LKRELPCWVGLLAGCLVWVSATQGEPRAVLDPGTYDAGEVFDSELVVVPCTVRNTGTSTLELTPRRASCQCVEVEWKTISVPPSDDVMLPITVDTTGRTGNHEYTVTFTTDDPNAPELELSIRLTVRPMLVFEPRRVHVDLQQGDTKDRSLEVDVRSDVVDLSTVQASLPEDLTSSVDVSAAVQPVDPAKKGQCRLVVRAKPAGNLGRFDSRIELAFDHQGEAKRRVIPLVVTVGSPYLDTNQAYLGIVSSKDTTGKKKAVLRCTAEATVCSVQCTLGAIRPSVAESGRQIVFAYDPSRIEDSLKLQRGLVRGWATVEFEDGQRLRLPVIYYLIIESS